MFFWLQFQTYTQIYTTDKQIVFLLYYVIHKLHNIKTYMQHYKGHVS